MKRFARLILVASVSAIVLSHIVAITLQSPLGAAAAIPMPVRHSPSTSQSLVQLVRLLALAPDDPSLSLDVEYMDVAGQLAAVGALAPLSQSDETSGAWYEATARIGVAHSPVWEYRGTSDFRDIFGFDAFQVDQLLSIGPSDTRLHLVHGRFDLATLEAAWRHSGYQETATDGVPIWSIRGDNAIDFSSAQGRLVLDEMNYAAVLPDDTLVFTSTRARLESELLVATGAAPSLADRSDIQLLLEGLPRDVTGAVIFDGRELDDQQCGYSMANNPNIPAERREQIRDALDALTTTVGTMPQIDFVALGITAGGPLPNPDGNQPIQEPDWPQAKTVISLLMDTQAQAEVAATIVLSKLEFGMSFSDREPWSMEFPTRTGQVLPGIPVVQITLDSGANQVGRWFVMRDENDLSFLAYGANPEDC